MREAGWDIGVRAREEGVRVGGGGGERKRERERWGEGGEVMSNQTSSNLWGFSE